jgi:hypothetical protein
MALVTAKRADLAQQLILKGENVYQCYLYSKYCSGCPVAFKELMDFSSSVF